MALFVGADCLPPATTAMWTKQHKKRRIGVVVVPVVTAAFLAYFGFHAWHGQYGIYAKYDLEKRVASLQAELERVKSRRMALESRVRMLQDGSIERDMLDEHARRALGVVRPDEVIVLRKRAAIN